MKKVIVMAVLAVFAFAVAVEAAQQQTSAQSAAAKDVAKTVPTTTTKVEQKPCKPNKDGTPCIGTPPSGQSGKPKEEKKKENPKTEKTSTKTISDKLDGYIAENLKANGVEPTPANIVAVKATSLTLWLDIKNILNKNAAEKTLKTLQMLDKGEISADQKAQAEKFVQNVIEATYHDKPDTVIKKEAKLITIDTAIVAKSWQIAGWKNVNEKAIKMSGQPLMTPLMQKRMMEKAREETKGKGSGASEPPGEGASGGGGGGGMPSQGAKAAGQTMGECAEGGDSGPSDDKTDYMPTDETSKAAKGMQGGVGATADPYFGYQCLPMINIAKTGVAVGDKNKAPAADNKPKDTYLKDKPPGYYDKKPPPADDKPKDKPKDNGVTYSGTIKNPYTKAVTKVTASYPDGAQQNGFGEVEQQSADGKTWVKVASGTVPPAVNEDGTVPTDVTMEANVPGSPANPNSIDDKAKKGFVGAEGTTKTGHSWSVPASSSLGVDLHIGGTDNTPTWEGEGGGPDCGSAAAAFIAAYNDCARGDGEGNCEAKVTGLFGFMPSASKGGNAPIDPPDMSGGNSEASTKASTICDEEGESNSGGGGENLDTKWLTSSTGSAVTNCGDFCGQGEPTGGVPGTDPISTPKQIQIQKDIMDKGGVGKMK